jgi:hypothetical protein
LITSRLSSPSLNRSPSISSPLAQLTFVSEPTSPQDTSAAEDSEMDIDQS